MELTFRGHFLPKSGRDLMELLYSDPFCGLQRACWCRTGALGVRCSAKLEHSCNRPDSCWGLAEDNGLARAVKFIIFTSFSYSVFPVHSPVLTFLFPFLSQRVCWQDFLYTYALLCAGVSEDGLAQCGEAGARLLCSSLSVLSLWPLPPVPWLQEGWTSSLCQKVALCLSSGPVKHRPGDRALDDLLGIQMVNTAQGKWQP